MLDYIEGVPFDQYADEHRLDVTARLALFLQVAAAVSHAHANLVVHRDLKPSNVLVDRAGRVALLDFGIARLLAEDEGSVAITSPTARALTPAFAAPEQLTRSSVTVGVDVFALGTLLYVLLAGRHPAEPALENTADLVQAIGRVDPPLMSGRAVDPDQALSGSPATIAAARSTTPARLRAVLRGELDTIVAKALKKTPAERQLRQRLPAEHTAFDSLALQRAQFAQLRGRIDEAHVLATGALARSEAGSQGSDLVPVALLRRAQIGLAAGQPEPALADARRAVELESSRSLKARCRAGSGACT